MNMGMKQMLGPGRMTQLTNTANQGVWKNLRAGNYGQAARSAGAAAVTKGLPFAGAMGASMLMPTFDQQQPQQQQPGMPGMPGMMYGAGQSMAGY